MLWATIGKDILPLSGQEVALSSESTGSCPRKVRCCFLPESLERLPQICRSPPWCAAVMQSTLTQQWCARPGVRSPSAQKAAGIACPAPLLELYRRLAFPCAKSLALLPWSRRVVARTIISALTACQSDGMICTAAEGTSRSLRCKRSPRTVPRRRA